MTNPQASDLNPHLWSQGGTKDAQECSSRGYCNRLTGHCMCYSKFGSSDGQGNYGDLGDCGYYDPNDPPTNCTTATPLWGSTEAMCSGESSATMVPDVGDGRCVVHFTKAKTLSSEANHACVVIGYSVSICFCRIWTQ